MKHERDERDELDEVMIRAIALLATSIIHAGRGNNPTTVMNDVRNYTRYIKEG